jgi:hypothetical protein
MRLSSSRFDKTPSSRDELKSASDTPEIGKRVLVDHAFIVAGGEITKAARNWLAHNLDASQRRSIIFMDREDIVNLYVVTSLPFPSATWPAPAAAKRGDPPF